MTIRPQPDPDEGNSEDRRSARWSDSYEEFRAIARALLAKEPQRAALQPTLLLHEVYLRLARRPQIADEVTRYFRACFANECRRLLAELARTRRLELTISTGMLFVDRSSDEVDAIDLDGALTDLESVHPGPARAVELRLFGGLSTDEIAETVACGRREVQRRLRFATTWLCRRLATGTGDGVD